ncbi:unnamed protein product [Pleuronectes platessa]|uniref:Uncharacterized protein n=1 Tax=Pleuronectes platessa TaxID=8262 RepID=A0A9N7V182_PLEPL|nr:unnamed protein product [Pleuronectes platessa]
MPRQQNAERPTADRAQRASSDLVWSCLATADPSVSQTVRPLTGLDWSGPSAEHTPLTCNTTFDLREPEFSENRVEASNLHVTALTSPPAVQAAAHPRHPDFEQRSLGERLLLGGRINGESHEACRAPGGGVELPKPCDVCASLHTTYCRSADCSKGEVLGRQKEEEEGEEEEEEEEEDLRPRCMSASQRRAAAKISGVMSPSRESSQSS